MIVMKSMELDDEDKLDTLMPIPMPNKPDYPYGLKICVTHKELRKLDVDPIEAVVGGIVHGHFMARITSVSADDSEHGGESSRVEMQIEDLALESEDGENEDDE